MVIFKYYPILDKIFLFYLLWYIKIRSYKILQYTQYFFLIVLVLLTSTLVSNIPLIPKLSAQSNQSDGPESSPSSSGETDDLEVEQPDEEEDDNEETEPPVAEITGPEEIEAGDTVVLSAQDSYDPKDGNLRYQWSYEGDVQLRLESSSASDSSTRFTVPSDIDNEEEIEVTLVVTNDDGDTSEPDTKSITIMPNPTVTPTLTPTPIPEEDQEITLVAIAEADKLDVRGGDIVNLNGRQSYAYDNTNRTIPIDIEVYEWMQEKNGAPYATDFNPEPFEVETSFQAPNVSEETELRFSLQVHADELQSDPDLISITVRPREAIIPVAIIDGPDTVVSGRSITFDGSRSYDPEGLTIRRYDWTQTDDNEDNSLRRTDMRSDDQTSKATFVAPTVNNNEVVSMSLLVTADDGDESMSVTKQVAIIPPNVKGPSTGSNGPNNDNNRPVAIIDVQGTDIVQPGSDVTLDGSRSYDPEGRNIIEYRWSSSDSQIQPAGQNPTIAIPSVSSKPFYEFSLIAVSDNGESIPDIQRVSVQGIIPNGDDCQSGFLFSLRSLGLESPSTLFCIPNYLPPVIAVVAIIAIIIGLVAKHNKHRYEANEDQGISSFRVKTDGAIEP
jgi:hypothetical protein